MDACLKYKRTVIFVVALAIMPLVCGHAFHFLIPCTGDLYRSKSHKTSLPAERGPCAVCKLLAMPRDIALNAAWDCVLDLIERREPEPVRLCVLLYRPFEPGRAPPVL